jgi:integrase
LRANRREQGGASKGAKTLGSPECFCSRRVALLKWRSTTEGISEYVFFNPKNPSRPILSVKTAWHNALRRAGLPRFPIYACRATVATRLAATGVSDTIIDQLLGHSRRDVLRFYTARVPEYLRDAMMRLAQLRSAKTAELAAQTIQLTAHLNDLHATVN